MPIIQIVITKTKGGYFKIMEMTLSETTEVHVCKLNADAMIILKTLLLRLEPLDAQPNS